MARAIFTRIKLVARACARTIARIKSEDWDIANIYKGKCKSPKYALIA